MPAQGSSGSRLWAFARELGRRKVWRLATLHVVVGLAVIAAAGNILPRLLTDGAEASTRSGPTALDVVLVDDAPGRAASQMR